MSNVVIVGTQWGDEGKGKITNALASCADYVVRFQGGANAGHTVTVNGEPIVFHLLPSGISVPGVRCIISSGVVVDPLALVDEIDRVRGAGISVDENLLIDTGAHMVLPYHKALEAAEEERRGDAAIGTTRRGIGPTYADRTSRTGLPIGLMANFDDFRGRFAAAAERKNEILTRLYGAEPLDTKEMLEQLEAAAARLSPHLADTPDILRAALDGGRNVLFEGAQGTLLDVAFGTYPFVTSSYTSAAGVSAGTGVPPRMIGEVIGIAKAYVTRVGAGPFPTELFDDDAETIRERGAERGSTTGRSRRCGWLDMVALRYAVAVNGIRRLIITKLDVLDTFETIPICVAYEIDGRRTETFPRTAEELERAVPVYEEFPGWTEDTSGCRTESALPANAMSYLRTVGEMAGVEVAAVSVGAAAHAVVEFAQILV